MNFYFDLVKSFLKKYVLLIVVFLFSLISLGFSLYNFYSLKVADFEKIANVTNQELISEDEKQNQSSEETKTAKDISEEKYYVDIKGYVKKPGVYKVNKDAIVNDCLNLAGGLLKNADTTTINLSKPVSAAMVIYVPKKNEVVKSTTDKTTTATTEIPNNAAIPDNNPDSSNDSNSSNEVPTLKINLNTATKEELTKLSGIGEAKAQDIIDYRNTSGPFKSIDEIKNISGIGDALFAKIKDNITI